MKRIILAAATAVAGLSGTVAMAQDAGAMAMLRTANGDPAGHVKISQAPGGTLFQAELKGLAPGWHSFHVHQVGSCEDGFDAAGDHYAPDGNEHGLLIEGGAHAGDLPNIYANENGDAMADFFSARLSVAEGDAPLMDEDGSAIVVHESADSYQEEAGAGGRVACGVITQTR